MVNPNDNNKPNEAARDQENLQEVSSEEENSTPVSSPSSGVTIQLCPEDAPFAADKGGSDDQAGGKVVAKRVTNKKLEEGECSCTTPLKIIINPKKKGHAPPNMADYLQGGKKVAVKKGKRPATGWICPSCSVAPAKKKKQQKKKGGDLLEAIPSHPPRCYVCNKLFKTWRAVFGHMRKHEATERWAVCPPAASPEEIDPILEELAPVLLNLAQQVLLESTRLDGLAIDLNQPGPSSLYQEGSTTDFDLNELPPPEEEEEEDKDGDDDDQNMDSDASS